jgi:tetratricopeptide (TPR) repeat protein
MNKALKVRVLVLMLAVLAGLVGGVHWLHGRQLRHGAPGLRARAMDLEQGGKLIQAAAYYHRYLQCMPDDIDTDARYALLLARTAQTPKQRFRAYLRLESVLRRDTGRHEVRRQAILLALHPDLERVQDAIDHLDKLMQQEKNNAQLEAWYAQAQLMDHHFDKAAEYFQLATLHDPNDIDSYAARAGTLREHLKKPREADAEMERMVKTVLTPTAYLMRVDYRRKFGPRDGIDKDVAEARRLAIQRDGGLKDVEVLLVSAAVSLDRKDRAGADEARQYLQEGLKWNPGDPRLYVKLAQAERLAGRPEEAVAALNRGLASPKLPEKERPYLLWALAEVLLQARRFGEVSATVGRLREYGESEPRLDYLEARIFLGRGEWLAATQLLQKIHPALQPWPEVLQSADLLLAECYGQLEDFDLQYSYLRRAVNTDPLEPAANLSMARCLEALGKPDEALGHYRVAIPRAPQAQLSVARLLIEEQRRLPRERRHWDEAEEALDQAANTQTDAVGVPLLRAEILAEQGRLQEAADVLRAVRQLHRKNEQYWLGLARVAERQGGPARAAGVLAEARAALGDHAELRLANAALAVRRGPAAVAELNELARGLDKFTAADQRRLLIGLAGAFEEIGDAKSSTKLWRQLAEQEKYNLHVRLVLFDKALERGDTAEMDNLVAELQRIEGPDGTLWRYARARDLVTRAQKGAAQDLQAIQELLQVVAAKRPTWARVHVCQGDLEELRGQKASALAKYEQAVNRLGERNPAVLRHMLELLYQQGRYKEAKEILKLLPQKGGLERLAAEVLYRSGEYTDALRLARQAVSLDSKDYRDHIWLGELLWAAGFRNDAEARLAHAVELAPNKPDPWVALVQVLALTGQEKKARARIAEAKAQLPAGQADLALAQCHEAVGDSKEAQGLYESALAAHPDDAAVLRGYIDFCLLGGARDKAMGLLETLLRLQGRDREEAAWAKRMLALLLTLPGNRDQAKRALQLLDLAEDTPFKPGAEESIADLRTKAVVLANQGDRRHRLEAIQFMQEVVKRQPPSAEDLFRLAQLYEWVEDWPHARENLLRLLSGNSDDRLYYDVVAHYALLLLLRNEADLARPWLEKLEAKLPNDLRTLELRCRYLVQKQKVAEALALVRARAGTQSQELQPLAKLLEELGKYDAAEEFLRRRLDQSKSPEAALDLARFLGRRRHLREAIDLCERARHDAPMAAVADAALSALYAARPPDPDQWKRVSTWLDEALAAADKKAELRVALALLRGLEGRYDDAVVLYQQVLEEDSRHALAMNNLAWLLAMHQNKPEEALAWLKKAEEIAGPAPDLLDTLGLVYLRLGQSAPALEALERAKAERPTALVFFHLAQAHHLARDDEAARTAWHKVQELKLSPADLHPLERPSFEKLLADLGAK